MANVEILAKHAHIGTNEVLTDIADTEREIAEMEREAEHLEKTPLSMPSARMDHLKAAARRAGIDKRKVFIAKLRHLLALRELASTE